MRGCREQHKSLCGWSRKNGGWGMEDSEVAEPDQVERLHKDCCLSEMGSHWSFEQKNDMILLLF